MLSGFEGCGDVSLITRTREHPISPTGLIGTPQSVRVPGVGLVYLSRGYRGSVAGRRSIYTGLFLEFEVASEVVFADNRVGCEFLGRTVKEDFPFK